MMEEDKIKLYCIFAKESLAKMNGNRGKMAAQAGHAYLHAYWASTVAGPDGQFKFLDNASAYRQGDRAYKICLVVDTVEQLKAIHEEYKDICGTSLVTDAGFTVFDEPTTTCLGIGPLRDSKKTDTLKGLKVLV